MARIVADVLTQARQKGNYSPAVIVTSTPPKGPALKRHTRPFAFFPAFYGIMRFISRSF